MIQKVIFGVIASKLNHKDLNEDLRVEGASQIDI